jgi:hypothetical protein
MSHSEVVPLPPHDPHRMLVVRNFKCPHSTIRKTLEQLLEILRALSQTSDDLVNRIEAAVA